MLILLAILSIFVAVSAYYFLHKREASEQLLDMASADVDKSHLRPLFMPTDDELRAEEAEARNRLEEARAAELEAAKRKATEEFADRLDAWRSQPLRGSIAGLFDAAGDDAEFFAGAAESVYDEWSVGRVAGLSASDLAQMLDSQFWLIPSEKRTPGVSFRLQRLLSGLRAASGEQIQTRDSLR